MGSHEKICLKGIIWSSWILAALKMDCRRAKAGKAETRGNETVERVVQVVVIRTGTKTATVGV